jgi:hypothetical protein
MKARIKNTGAYYQSCPPYACCNCEYERGACCVLLIREDYDYPYSKRTEEYLLNKERKRIAELNSVEISPGVYMISRPGDPQLYLE